MARELLPFHNIVQGRQMPPALLPHTLHPGPTVHGRPGCHACHPRFLTQRSWFMKPGENWGICISRKPQEKVLLPGFHHTLSSRVLVVFLGVYFPAQGSRVVVLLFNPCGFLLLLNVVFWNKAYAKIALLQILIPSHGFIMKLFPK